MYFRRLNRPAESHDEQRRRHALDLEPMMADRWLSRPMSSYFRGLRDGHIKAVLSSSMSVADKPRAVASTLHCFSVRFGVTSPYLAGAMRIGRKLPRRVRERLIRVE
jgi:hypothetical protein